MKTIGTVKNPLTIIAIFASLVEVSASAVLPFIDPGLQSLYIWFLMLFPSLLVIAFFITLNWNNKVLYAPSDFDDEKNFMNANISKVIVNYDPTDTVIPGFNL